MDKVFSKLADPEPVGQASPTARANSYRIPAYSAKDLRFRMDWDKQVRLWAGFAELLPILYSPSDCEDPQLQRRSDIIEDIVRRYWAVFTDLRRPTDFTADEVDAAQLLMDGFCRALVAGYSVKDVTNYVHDLQAGHIRYFLRRHGNIYRHCNIGLEATVKVLRTFAQVGTQHAGHAGNECRKPQEAIAGGAGTEAPLEKWPTARAMAAYALKRGLNQLSKFATSPRLYMLHKIDVGRDMDLRRRHIVRKRKLEALQSELEMHR
ncbi:hypothetical protein B484DRAFT_440786 [Ochromonadaceae sp. CCMP2298]|nr:hypothetical protein B484DRAFT_440786 [Ochromonadaceae sp. CCMP2298]